MPGQDIDLKRSYLISNRIQNLNEDIDIQTHQQCETLKHKNIISPLQNEFQQFIHRKKMVPKPNEQRPKIKHSISAPAFEQKNYGARDYVRDFVNADFAWSKNSFPLCYHSNHCVQVEFLYITFLIHLFCKLTCVVVLNFCVVERMLYLKVFFEHLQQHMYLKHQLV